MQKKSLFKMKQDELISEIHRLEKEIEVSNRIKTDWIESQIVGKEFPQDYILGKKRLTEMQKFNMKMLKEAQVLNSAISEKYFELLTEHNILFTMYQDLKDAFEKMKERRADNKQ